MSGESHDVSGRLVLQFDGGTTIELDDISEEYESYQIANGVQLIVV